MKLGPVITYIIAAIDSRSLNSLSVILTLEDNKQNKTTAWETRKHNILCPEDSFCPVVDNWHPRCGADTHLFCLFSLLNNNSFIKSVYWP